MAGAEMAEREAFDKKSAKRAEKMRKKEEKKRKKGTPNSEDEEEESGIVGKIAIAFITLVIIVIWLGIMALLIKLDVGGFGSTVLYPVLKDVPYINKILPETEEEQSGEVVDVQYPYATLEEAINRIKELEVELSAALESNGADAETISQLQAEIKRLQGFEAEQARFQEEKTKFYQEVVFSDNAPDIEEYRVYYESIDPANAAELYKQVVQQVEENEDLTTYAQTYASMKPKQAAALMEAMKNDMKLVAKILEHMDVESRAGILDAMDSQFAAQVTKLMEPKTP